MRLTTNLPEWAIRGDPEPTSLAAVAAGCRCLRYEVESDGTVAAWNIEPECKLHGYCYGDTSHGWYWVPRSGIAHIRNTLAAFDALDNNHDEDL